MDHMTGGMMWGMGLIGILVLLLLVLGVAALAKYLFFSQRRRMACHYRVPARTNAAGDTIGMPRTSSRDSNSASPLTMRTSCPRSACNRDVPAPRSSLARKPAPPPRDEEHGAG
jgi:hypothetical protein